jgi:peptide/nickel transport system substrate-binding protein
MMEFENDPSSEKQDFVATLAKERSVPHISKLESLLKRFSTGERLVLYALSILLAGSAFVLLMSLSARASVTVPVQGGSLTEGEVGPARFINPLLTLSQPDFDITELVYSGLMRAQPDGSYIPDLASSYEISADGTTYTFHLRTNATFQDGTPVSAGDVLYTVQLAQNPDIKSPRQADWIGVSVSAPDTHTIVFKLPHPYAPFIEDTTMGILPKHLWQNVSAEEFPFSPLNTHPVGSGPYRVTKVTTDSTGSATRYDLAPFQKFVLGAPYLGRISFIFYSNDADLIKAFDAHQIDAIAGASPLDLPSLKRTDVDIATMPLPRTFAVFLNQNHAPVLADSAVRGALDAAVDKNGLVNSVLNGYGAVLDGPIPPDVSGDVVPAMPTVFTNKSTSAATTSASSFADHARAILQKGGWAFDSSASVWKKTSGKTKLQLSFTLATADEPELVATAKAIVADWNAAGIKVSLQVYPLSELNTNVIRPRSYDALLFGEVDGRSLDLFAFWHSSQRNDPGLNLAMYANTKADALLSQARATTDERARNKLYAQFAAIVAKDQPAIFLYSPEFIYIVPTTLEGIQIGALTTPAERYLNVYQWYTDTKQVWSIFTN